MDIFGQVYNQWKNKECECPNCKRLIAASRFAPHLEKCLGMGRNSSRIANRRSVSGRGLSGEACRTDPKWAGTSNSGCLLYYFYRLASNNNMSKSESDQEDNDDLNDNDWSYGAEKKGNAKRERTIENFKFRLMNSFLISILQPRRESQIRYFFVWLRFCSFRVNFNKNINLNVFFIVQNQNSPRRSKSIKHKNGESSRFMWFLACYWSRGVALK